METGLAEQLNQILLVTGTEMSKAAVPIGTGAFLWGRGGIYEERIYFWRPHYPVD